MNSGFIVYAVGKLLQVLAVVLLVPGIIAVTEALPATPGALFSDPRVLGFILAIAGSLCAGTVLSLLPRGPLRGQGVREGFAIVTFGWIVLALFGSIPLYVWMMHDTQSFGAITPMRAFTDAFFEIMSGFSTTGATVIVNIEALPASILFWRSLTHWLGGMGIVTLALAVFPAFGVAAYQMYRGEVPGPGAERLKPRLEQTAKILWGVYAFLTIAQAFLLYLGGMTLLEAFCHAFGTMATGGFSTRNASIAAFNSAYIDWVVIAFMFMAGMNFMLHYHVLFRGDLRVLRADREFQFYGAVILLAVIAGVTILSIQGVETMDTAVQSHRETGISMAGLSERIDVETARVAPWGERVRHAAFQVVSITTTTGFITADFDFWPVSLRFIQVSLMFFGGCAGSTGGGIKMIRLMVVLKAAARELRVMVQPRLIAPVKIAGRTVEEARVSNIVGFFMLFIMLFVAFSAIMSLFVPDLITATTSVAATLSNIGPGLGGVGPTMNYAWIPAPGKWILTVCMLLGRLEIYTVLIAFSPVSWRK